MTSVRPRKLLGPGKGLQASSCRGNGAASPASDWPAGAGGSRPHLVAGPSFPSHVALPALGLLASAGGQHGPGS